MDGPRLRKKNGCNNSNSIQDYGTFDFIIIGGGTAGGVLANRLTEEPFTVLVIEAGEEPPVWAAVQGLFAYFFNSKWNWGYNTTQQTTSCLGMKSKQCFYPRAKVLGGCSVIHGGVYVRGDRKDYDEWEQMGNHGWSYDDCLPYFKKSERANFSDVGVIDRKYHGFDGVQGISIPPDTEGLTPDLVNALKSITKKEIDYNGAGTNGAGRMQFYLDHNIRSSTDYAFVKPVVHRANLKISLHSLATKILISEKKKMAEKVEFIKNGQRYIARARKEIIVSAGSINSPQVLMLSGIGPAAELKKHDIKVVADLPVGENLYDHTMYNAICFRTNQVFYNNTLLENLDLWREGKRPLVAGIGIHAVAFINHKIEVYMHTSDPGYGALFQMTDEYVKAFSILDSHSDICASIALLKPDSFGKVTLRSNDARDYPLIDPKHYSNPADLKAMYTGIEEVLKLVKTGVFKQWDATLLPIAMPGCDESHERLSKDWWYCSLMSVSNTMFHPTGTTRMGPHSKSSVVNSELKVHGFKNLRVVDAGVIPSHMRSHMNAPVVMIAEKISDAIKKDWR